METKPDLENIYCRLCLVSLEFFNENGDFADISNDTRLVLRITEIFGFNPVATKAGKNHFSSVLCNECHGRVNSIAEFIDNVQRNQKLLESASIDVPKSSSSEGLEIGDELDDVLYVKQEDEEMQVEYLDNDFDNNDVICDVKDSCQYEEKPYICHFCSKTFVLKASLTEHMDQKHLRFEYHTNTKRFKEIHSGPGKNRPSRGNVSSISKYLFCELCENRQNFQTFKDMTEHYQERHGTRGYVRCCNKQFFTRKSVVNHSDVHTNPTDYMCKICQKLLPDKYTLRDHILRHNPDKDRKFECDHCQKKFHVQKDLADHINRLHRTKYKKEERETCVECNKSFVSKYSLMTHNRRFHMDLERPICKLRFLAHFISEKISEFFFSRKFYGGHFFKGNFYSKFF